MQFILWPFSFAFASAGNNIAARIAMIAITTSNSINVKPLRQGRCNRMDIVVAFCTDRYGLNLAKQLHESVPISRLFPYCAPSVSGTRNFYQNYRLPERMSQLYG